MTRKLINIRMNVMCSSRGEIRVGHHLTTDRARATAASRDQGQTSDLDAALAAGVAGVTPPPPPLREQAFGSIIMIIVTNKRGQCARQIK